MNSKVLFITIIGASFDLLPKSACDDSHRNHARSMSKRQGAYQICTDNFEIYVDRIIRTHDSQELGAKYITEREVLNREECLKLCCETEGCDVFVFEEKRPGSCFMFECGSREDFKCQFTSHQNYTSAVLTVNRRMSDLETQIKFTQHEHELNKLRVPEKQENVAPIIIKTTPKTSGNKETLEVIPDKVQPRCNMRIQFECHTSHECIAIYNVCDGIPQCQDGSDEAQELGCPTQAPIVKQVITTTTTTPPPRIEQEVKIDNADDKVNYRGQPQPPPQGFQPPDMGKAIPDGGFRQNYPPNNQLAIESARAAYGREGEGLAFNRGGYQTQYQFHPNQGGSQIFNHKGGLVQNEQYPPRNYQENVLNPMPNYNEQQISNYYGKYNNYYDPQNRIAPQNMQYNQYQYNNRNSNEMIPPVPEDNPGMVKNDKFAEKALPPQDYYDEAYRARNRPQPPQPAFDHKAHAELNSLKKEKPVPPVQQKIQKATTALPTVKTTTKKVKAHHKVDKANKWSLVKFEKLTADSAFTIVEGDEHPSPPSGAILSLTLGLLMTAIMVTLIGCRIRTVRRRLRRGGKGGYAHDADFLVNGMYL